MKKSLEDYTLSDLLDEYACASKKWTYFNIKDKPIKARYKVWDYRKEIERRIEQVEYTYEECD